uniref:Uncharacterized protein n=1 Tax=Chenopodium quinoa TaxID=63459 RepID=A0A803KSU6_CHEQI
MDSQDTLIGTQPESYDRTKDLKVFDARKTGVKGLVEEGTKEIPSIFVRPHEDRSKDLGTCHKDISVPIIDLA